MFGAAPAPAYTTAAAPAAVATAAPQVLIVRSLKSRGVAAVLEFFIPGTGAMYAGQVALGLLWLLVAVGLQVGGPLAIIKSASSSSDGSAYSYDPSIGGYGSSYASSGLDTRRVQLLFAFGAAAVIWLIVRMVLATRYVDRLNNSMTMGALPTTTNNSITGGGALNVTTRATSGSFPGIPTRAWVSGLFAVILLSDPNILAIALDVHYFRLGNMLVAVPGLMFFLALMRFVRTEARRAATEVGVAAGIVVALAAITGSILPQGLVIFVVLCALAIGLAAGCVVGFGCPPIRGPQSEVRDLFCLLVVIVLVVVAVDARHALLLRIGVAVAIVPAALIWATVVVRHSRKGAIAPSDAGLDHTLE